jgi:hypothetical protein
VVRGFLSFAAALPVVGLAVGLAAGVALAAEPTVTMPNGAPGTYGDAMRWYRAQAEQGYARAQFLLGYKYEVGEGVSRDLAAARKWYSLAAGQGEALALYRLARLHHEGRGGSRDLAEAARLYRGAADRGHAAAQAWLGYLYTSGTGVDEDKLKAFLWLALAARAGEVSAAENLALLERVLTEEQIAAGRKLLEVWSPEP